MADADGEAEPTVQQEQQASDEADPDAAVPSDAADSPSPEGAPQTQAQAPAEPDGSPAVEATHVNVSADQNPPSDGQSDTLSPTGSPPEEESAGPDSPEDIDSAHQDMASPSSAGAPGQEEGQVDSGASLNGNQEADAAAGGYSCSGPALPEQPAADAHVEPESDGAPLESPPPEEPPIEDPPPTSVPTEAPPAAPPADTTVTDDLGPSEAEAAVASESPGMIAASPGSRPGVGNGSPPADTAAPISHTARPIRGTLAKPNRGFHGLFVTRHGRKLTPEELVQSVERLSKADLFGVDMKELLAMYGNATKAKTAVGKPQISPDEIESMVERLYTTKPKQGMTYKARPTPMKAIFYIENGAHLSRLEPIAPKPAQERTEFMCALYERCKESKMKSQQTLADKYLQPLCKPKVYSGPDGKAKISEIAQKLFAGESTK